MAKTAQPGSNNTGYKEEEQNAIEAAILQRIEAGEIFEDMDDLSPKFKAILKMTADLAAVSEVSVLTWAYTAYRTAPDIGAKIAVCATAPSGLSFTGTIRTRPGNGCKKQWTGCSRSG